MLIRMLSSLLVVTLIGCGSSGAAPSDGGVPDGSDPDGSVPIEAGLIVDTDWLEANLGNPDLQPIDTRASGFSDSRIPGAIRLRPEQFAVLRDDVSFQVPLPAAAEPTLRAAGLRNDTVAVVYGEGPEYDPARIVWALSYYGHGDVRYLDGGYDAWVAAGGALDSDPANVEPTEYTIGAIDEDLRVTGDWVLSQLGDAPYDMPAIQVVDARSEGEYGNGRIPNALSVNWTRNLGAGFLLADPDLEALYPGLDPTETTVTYCLSGWRGAFAWLTLTHLGYDDVRLYDGSWNEWGNGEFPVEQ